MNRGESRPESRVSVGSGSVDLADYGMQVDGPRLQESRRSPASRVGSSSPTGGMSEELRFKLEMKRLEVEKEERLEARRMELEMEAALRRERAEAKRLEHEEKEAERNRRFELEKTRLEVNSPHRSGGVAEKSVESQMVRSLKLIPEFDEGKVTEWFRRFEKKASEFAWPQERWVGLVANMLKGKALEVYDRMSVEDLDDYEEFKADILRAYELRPEAYRLQFRNSKKRPGDSYLECARYLEESFEKWLASERTTTYRELKELMIMEQFTNVAERELVPLLREKRFKSLKEAATWADDHVLAFKGVAQQGGGGGHQDGGPRWQGSKNGSGSSNQTRLSMGAVPKTPGGSRPSHFFDTRKQTPGQVTTSTPKYNNQPRCYSCKATGHFKFNCPKLLPTVPATPAAAPKPPQRPVALLMWPDSQSKEDSLVPPVGGSVDKSSGDGLVSSALPLEVVAPSLPGRSELEWCRPFLCKGTVSVDGETYPVTVLRDTAAQQSMCRNVTGRRVATGKAVLCRGINTVESFATAQVKLVCPLVTTEACVAMADHLPVAGVDFLLGNDLAGGRVWVQPSPCEAVVEVDEPETAPEAVAVVTRAAARRVRMSATPGGDCKLAVPPERESSEVPSEVPEAGLSSQSAGDTSGDGGGESYGLSDVFRDSPHSAVVSGEALDCVGEAVEGGGGESALGLLFPDSPHPAAGPGGSTLAECFSHVGKVSSGARSRSRCEGSCMEVTPEGGETSSSAGKVGVSSPQECIGGEGHAVPLPGELCTDDSRLSDGTNVSLGASSLAAAGGRLSPAQPAPQVKGGRRRRRGAGVSALPLSPDSDVPPNLNHVEPAELMEAQQEDEELAPLFARVGEGSEKVGGQEEFVLKDGVLYRRWVEEDIGELTQVVVPSKFREPLVLLAHEGPMAGHLGIRKTVARLRRNFWWPGMAACVATVLRCCHTCQVVGKPNQAPPVAPLHPIPAVAPPFTRVLIDIVGPLPPSRAGHKYLLTIMDVTTRYPEAIPLRSTHTKVVLKALLNFFTHFGLPSELQSDQGTNFTSRLFNQTMAEWGIRHILSSAYHPQSQGALERHHQTLKNMMRAFCMEHEKDWDEAVPYIMFAVREVPTESLGFSPNQLVFGHRVRGPLDVVRDAWCGVPVNSPQPLLTQVLRTRERLVQAWDVAREHLGRAQRSMKEHYDRRAKYRSFNPGDEVLVLLPLQGQPLAARYSGPYVVEARISDLDYLVSTPDRRKKAQLCHLNMLKPYFRRDGQEGPFSSAVEEAPLVMFLGSEGDAGDTLGPEPVVPTEQWDHNSVDTLRGKLSHLEKTRGEELLGRLLQYPAVFSKVPGRTALAVHDIDVGDSRPVKLPPYRTNPHKQKLLEEELQYMLAHGLITRAYSEWSSPVTLQPKPDGRVRFCVDFRKVNALTKADTYPLPRVDDSVDRIGAATYITKIDLVKGYWQVPLTERAKEIASFVANGAVYQCQVMPYGLKNAPATFQRLMDRVVDGLENCVVYIDDVVIYDTTWHDHIAHVEALFARLQHAGLVVNLEKCDFVKARVQYLGYVVGHGCVTPPEAKVEAIRRFPAPTCRRALQRFLGVVGYYRRFVPGYSTMLAPLTDLLQKGRKWAWDEKCERAFKQLKDVLCSMPVLRAPDFSKPFALAVDASQEGVGAVLLQPDEKDVNHPVSYFSRKFTPAQRNYSVVEQELLAIILALQHFEVYVPAYGPQVTVFSDHSPLQFLGRFKYKNMRLTRWSLLLQEYNLLIQHIRGAENVTADCLSRAGQ